MVSWFKRRQTGPIGIDIGSRWLKLMQFDREQSDLRAVARYELPACDGEDARKRDEQTVSILLRARRDHAFRGREAVVCLSGRELFVQNLRVPQTGAEGLGKVVANEASSRLPFAAKDAQVRFLEVADVRQMDSVRREVVVLACKSDAVEHLVDLTEQAGLTPVAIDAEPAAMLRSYARQFRRQNDDQVRFLLVNIGAASTAVVIARNNEAMFVKYLDIGGRQLDEAVARHLQLDLPAASALRRQGDRRTDQHDQELSRGLADAQRPVLEQLVSELAMCIRYYGVTFRGQPLSQGIVSGGEAQPAIVEWLSSRLDLPCEMGNPVRIYKNQPAGGRLSQWDVAAGLALRTPA